MPRQPQYREVVMEEMAPTHPTAPQVAIAPLAVIRWMVSGTSMHTSTHGLHAYRNRKSRRCSPSAGAGPTAVEVDPQPAGTGTRGTQGTGIYMIVPVPDTGIYT